MSAPLSRALPWSRSTITGGLAVNVAAELNWADTKRYLGFEISTFAAALDFTVVDNQDGTYSVETMPTIAGALKCLLLFPTAGHIVALVSVFGILTHSPKVTPQPALAFETPSAESEIFCFQDSFGDWAWRSRYTGTS